MKPQAEDGNWPRASNWLSGDHVRPPVGALGILGVPLRDGAITPGRCDLAPAAFRAALARFSTWDLIHGCDLRDIAVRDHGDLPVGDAVPEDAAPDIGNAVRAALPAADALIVLGGHNGITHPAMCGMAPALRDCGLLTLDAHLDLRDLAPGHTNGNPVRALLRDGLPGTHVVQIGIQSFANAPRYARLASESGITVVTVEEVRRRGIEQVVSSALASLAERTSHIYVDLDMDVLDRAFAPATAGSRPGGLAPWEVQAAARICGAHHKVRVLDLVEVDPTRDVAEATVLAGASCMLAFAAGLRRRFPDA